MLIFWNGLQCHDCMARWLRYAASHCFNQPCSQLTTSSLTAPESNRCQKLPGPCARKTSTLAKDTTSPAVCRSGVGSFDGRGTDPMRPWSCYWRHALRNPWTMENFLSSQGRETSIRLNQIWSAYWKKWTSNRTTNRLLKKAFAFKTFWDIASWKQEARSTTKTTRITAIKVADQEHASVDTTWIFCDKKVHVARRLRSHRRHVCGEEVNDRCVEVRKKCIAVDEEDPVLRCKWGSYPNRLCSPHSLTTRFSMI